MNSTSLFSSCPGCGLTLVAQGLERPERYHASGECWALYGQLSAYNAERAERTFIAQHAVDAYGAGHSGGPTKAITTAFSLIGLHLALERGFTGRQVQQAHMQLARAKWVWPEFTPPDLMGTLTVQDVLQAEWGAARDGMILEWAASVWSRWTPLYAWTRAFCDEHLKR